MEKLISFKIYAEKGFFKKPDINDGIYLTYNMLHKPALLGILGAIVGLPGYKRNGELPEYYKQFNSIPIGIKPINDEKGNFQKTIISYNNTTGLASNEPGGNLIVTEQTLVAPAYKVYLLLDIEKDNHALLYENITNQHAEFLPYLGKNDYSLWWDKEEVEEYDKGFLNEPLEPFSISTIFNKKATTLKESKYDDINDMDMFDAELSLTPDSFVSFERLPVSFDENLMQYAYADFVFTSYKLKPGAPIHNVYSINSKQTNKTEYVQLN